MIPLITSTQNEILMSTMRESVSAQNGPKVGMFWYNPARNMLIGVHSAFAAELPFNDKGRKTLQVLHHTAWPGVRKAAIAIGSADSLWDEEDYTRIPRGRVFEIEMPDKNARQFDILVGSWAEEYPKALALIIDEFNLDGVKYDFIHSAHRDVGRGTSELFI